MPIHETCFTRRAILKTFGSVTAAALLGDVTNLPGLAAALPQHKLPRTSPDEAGIGAHGIIGFLDDVDKKVGGLHSFMLVRHGKVAAEGWWSPYRPEFVHTLYSLSKSFTSTALGFAVADGKLTVDDPVISFFPDKLPANMDENLRAMRVRHLLTMNTGHDKDATGPVTAVTDGDWVRAFLALPVEHAPGSKFVYNSAATYMCSAIVQKLVGMPVVEYLTPRLFEPLGIKDHPWESCPKGINCGGWGLSIKTEDIARFGESYLRHGKWHDRQLVPASWVEQASSKQVSNGDGGASDWAQGYGYQFWRCRHNAFRGDGAFGQYCIVMPEQDAVLAITSGVGDMQAVMNAAWDNLLPAMTSGAAGSGDNPALRDRIAKLEVPSLAGTGHNFTASRVSGKAIRFEPNDRKAESAKLECSADRCTLTISADGAEEKIACGHREWIRGHKPGTSGLPRLGAPPVGKIAAKGAWTGDDTYGITVCYVETPYVETITCKFSGDEASISRKMNVGFGNTNRPPLKGRIA